LPNTPIPSCRTSPAHSRSARSARKCLRPCHIVARAMSASIQEL
jgi:hypothetical protein